MLELIATIEATEVQATILHALTHYCGSLFVFVVDHWRIMIVLMGIILVIVGTSIKLANDRLVSRMVPIRNILLLLTTDC